MTTFLITTFLDSSFGKIALAVFGSLPVAASTALVLSSSEAWSSIVVFLSDVAIASASIKNGFGSDNDNDSTENFSFFPC
jgi:hypothetical protein